VPALVVISVAGSAPTQTPTGQLPCGLAAGVALLAMLAVVVLLRWRRRMAAVARRGASAPAKPPPLDPWQEAGRRSPTPPREDPTP